MSMQKLDLNNPEYYFNRELSWLKFNDRVLEEAIDESNPLLERLKFLAIFSSNLDEFMMIRYAGLKEQVAAGVDKRTADGMTPSEQLLAISEKLHIAIEQHRKILEDVLQQLEKYDIKITTIENLGKRDLKSLNKFFDKEVFPVLTPLAIDASHPFPHLANLSFSLLLELLETDTQEKKLAIVQVPNVLPRFFRLSEKKHRFIILEDIIKFKIESLFPGHLVKQVNAFKLTRNADIEIAEDEADDLLRVIEDGVRRRRWGDAVRLSVEKNMPKKWRKFLQNTHNLDKNDVFLVNRLNISDFMQLASIDIPELRDPPLLQRIPSEYRNKKSIFDAIKASDILLHHPFHAFDAVLDLINEAANDPNVLAIKQTLYRVGPNSLIVKALAEAAGNGKLVTALVELKARFDEENNIIWAKELERSGVHVVYGFPNLKTHCKSLLIIRREGKDIRRYMHIGTGNYNPVTSKLYTDMGLLTCDEDLAADSSELFNYLTGFSKQTTWRKLLIAPVSLRTGFLEAIEKEIFFANAGQESHIIAKMNSLVDPQMIRALYRASQAGIRVQLNIRGICCLRPGLEGLSENISVHSIVGRFLEHSRVFYFKHGGENNIYIGSADWMPRNLDRRIEAIAPIENPKLKRKIMHILDVLLRDNVKTRVLQSDGEYLYKKRTRGQRKLNAQERLLELSVRRL